MKVITLPNKLYTTVKLVEQPNGRWKFDRTKVEYVRFLYGKKVKDGIRAIDPEGGPQLSIGDWVEGYIVEHIADNAEITLREVNDDKTV
jgi:hypothetical protein